MGTDLHIVPTSGMRGAIPPLTKLHLQGMVLSEAQGQNYLHFLPFTHAKSGVAFFPRPLITS